MDDLKGSIGLNAYAQRNPISEYRILSADLFDEMTASIREDTVRMLLSVQQRRQEIKRVEVAKVKSEGFAGSGEAVKKKPVVIKKAERVGRNDPCPCGSGKKYKKCCGANDTASE
jgi:preprotein translocase subunit SecA